jgi:hypothetical protein
MGDKIPYGLVYNLAMSKALHSWQALYDGSGCMIFQIMLQQQPSSFNINENTR